LRDSQTSNIFSLERARDATIQGFFRVEGHNVNEVMAAPNRYEAAIRTNASKTWEYAVNAGSSPQKEE
jgi:hypothetical protein